MWHRNEISPKLLLSLSVNNIINFIMLEIFMKLTHILESIIFIYYHVYENFWHKLLRFLWRQLSSWKRRDVWNSSPGFQPTIRRCSKKYHVMLVTPSLIVTLMLYIHRTNELAPPGALLPKIMDIRKISRLLHFSDLCVYLLLLIINFTSVNVDADPSEMLIPPLTLSNGYD